VRIKAKAWGLDRKHDRIKRSKTSEYDGKRKGKAVVRTLSCGTRLFVEETPNSTNVLLHKRPKTVDLVPLLRSESSKRCEYIYTEHRLATGWEGEEGRLLVFYISSFSRHFPKYQKLPSNE
jgi:hypothetical protein